MKITLILLSNNVNTSNLIILDWVGIMNISLIFLFYVMAIFVITKQHFPDQSANFYFSAD